jgi:hypothetical protein
MKTTAQIVANMAATPERDFWLTATKPCGRSFRLRIKRHWLFAVTLQHWPFKVNEQPISAAEACRAFDDLKPEFWAKLPRGAQVKIHRWIHHFAERHAGVMIACTGTLDLNPEWTAAIQRIPCHPLAPIAFPPRPAYTPEQIAGGGRIIADMRSGGWLRW